MVPDNISAWLSAGVFFSGRGGGNCQSSVPFSGFVVRRNLKNLAIKKII